MLHLHLGWPKTGTTSLQAALAGHRPLLESRGILYPDRWHWDDESHNGLAMLVDEAAKYGDDRFGEVLAFLDAARAEHVVLSTEVLFSWSLSEQRYDSLLRLLDAIRAVEPLRCVWTLRRLDDQLVSIFAQPRRGGYADAQLRWLLDAYPVERTFARMREVEALVGDVAFVRYAPDGGHVEALLTELGLPADVAADVARAVRAGPRIRPRLSRKQLIALGDTEALAAGCGVPLDSSRLLGAFREGFRFAADGPADPLDGRTRRQLHERALTAASEASLDAYVRFFAADRIADSPSGGAAAAGRLSAADVAALAAFLRG